MMRIVRVQESSFEAVVREAAQALKKGKVVACPTDTVYGFVADATNAKAVRKIFRIKGREKGKPIPIFVKDIAMAKSLATIGKPQEAFLKKVWPGKITAVLKSRGVLPKEVGIKETIGLRIPNHDFVLKLLEKFGKPLTGTSANLSGAPSLSDSKEVIAQFGKRKYQPDLVLDAGVLPKSKPSKVIDVTGTKKEIIRN